MRRLRRVAVVAMVIGAVIALRERWIAASERELGLHPPDGG